MKGSRHIHAFSIIVIFVAIGLLGCVLLPLLPLKLKPSGELPAISVSCNLRGASPNAVENTITAPLEGSLARVSGIKHIRSKSSSGKSSINLEFEKGTDMGKARFEVASIVRQIYSSLPVGTSFPRVNLKSVNSEAAGPFMAYSFNASMPSNQIYNYIDKHISPTLKSIPGVESVKLSGASPMQWKIEYDAQKLSELQITPADIKSAVSNSGCRDSIDAEKIVLKNYNGSLVRLSDVAIVSHCQEEPTNYFRINGRNTVYLKITAEQDANQIKLSKKIRETMEGLPIPSEIELGLDFDSSEQVSNELDTIYFRCGLTILILLIFIALITLNVKYMLVISISLFLSLAVSIIFYYIVGVEIHLYSLSALTISLNLVIDNIIVVTEQLARGKSLRSFTAILAATLTTIGAMSIIFFFDDNTILNLRDFAIVMIINLSVSLLTALFLVPALIDKMNMSLSKKKVRRKRLTVKIYRIYGAIIRFIVKWKWIFIIVFISAIGGSIYLFVKFVYEGDYFNKQDRDPVLQINASLPNGATLKQMNDIVAQMESLLSGEEGIDQFQTNIYNARNANITVYFKPEYKIGYPYSLQSEVIQKANSIGGGSWSVFGLDDMGFSNYVGESAGNNRIKLTGYSYDGLMKYASELSDSLLQLKRIQKVNVSSEISYYTDNDEEMILTLDRRKLAKDSLSIKNIFDLINRETYRNGYIGYMNTDNGSEPITIGNNSKGNDWWQLMNSLYKINGKVIKLGDYAKVDKQSLPADIVREDQEYIVYLQYDYIGSYKACERISKRIVDNFNNSLPAGYKAEIVKYGTNNDDDTGKYWLLGLVAVIIFFITAILFDSLKLPLAVISTIPISFIGVFVAFYLFSIKFDQGGFASLILLSGITVNASIYVINEYKNLKDQSNASDSIRFYTRSLRRRITAIMLTVLSTILGFIPFLIGKSAESFWYPLAVGTMSGLLFSLIAIVLILPMILIPRTKRKTNGIYAKD